MDYIVAGTDNFEEDRLSDPAIWKWFPSDDNPDDSGIPEIENGQIIISGPLPGAVDPNGTRTIFGQFLVGGNHMSQRTTVKFSKPADQYVYASTRVRKDPDALIDVFRPIGAVVGPTALSIASDGGTYVNGPEVDLDEETWYWLRCTIDNTRNVLAELFDSDPDTDATPFATFNSDLPDDPDAYVEIPGTSGFIATTGVIIDEIRSEYIEESAGSEREIRDRRVPHEAAHRKVVDDELKRISDHAAIPDLASSASDAYDQSEAEAVRSTVNEILDVMRDSGLIPSE